uniref:Aspartyl/Glutamyl-tRNA(Gln) amidotransferase subunit B/E catalytic domain-containing protein n=1 Tax=Globisporangium ultimum (strain ATCC 200006 / CBS 805.95 / DAOM BR144) TaxID=431595 RepID=K3X071_GLOUD
MEEGSMRCDLNVNVRRQANETFDEWVEVKNMNSICNISAKLSCSRTRKTRKFAVRPDQLTLSLEKRFRCCLLRSKNDQSLPPYESLVLVNEAGAVAFFEDIAAKKSRPSKLVINWVLERPV